MHIKAKNFRQCPVSGNCTDAGRLNFVVVAEYGMLFLSHGGILLMHQAEDFPPADTNLLLTACRGGSHLI